MQIIRSLLWGFLLTLSSLPAFAWQVSLQPDKADTPIITVSTDRELEGVDVYLVWYDIDGKNDKFVSLVFNDELPFQWQSGLKPVFSAALDIAPFEWTIGAMKPSCPTGHRCFLAFVAISHGLNTDSQNWQAASLLPLTLEASRERLPGQQFFLSADSNIDRLNSDDGQAEDAMMAEDAGNAPAPAPTADKQAAPAETTVGSGTPETEKPDIFQLVGDKLLYANGQAKRFQVIDLSNVNQPRLQGWTALLGNPRELYVLNDYYILLQSAYASDEGTYLTVLRQAEDGTLEMVQKMSLSGQFIESRRRNDIIYSVTQTFVVKEEKEEIECVRCFIGNESIIKIQALRLTASGQLEEVDMAQVPGYAPQIAIFPNYLVIANHNPQEQQWQTTQIQVIDLSQDDPLVELSSLKVPGQVPSEFHLSVVEDQFRVVYGPENREDGSTLAIYQLPSLNLLGTVDKIAPGEDLFATRFVNDRAFVVTYERQDPLWVIDLSNPVNPKILGELHVPGWSEKMFFHQDRLFAVGIDDQPLENEENRWVRRVALSLFDVTDPTQPTLINRFTPLAGEVSYSYSPALDDERALLLNWEDAFAALPINSWELDKPNHLQIVSLENDQITDAGRLDTPVQIQRSFSLAPDILAGLGDQALFTLRWGKDKPKVLGELELATNLAWLELQDNQLWVAALGDNGGYHRFYQYTTADVETPSKNWQLPKGYYGIKMADNLIVFYDYYPSLAAQVLDVKTGKLYPAQALEIQNQAQAVPLTETADEPMIAPESKMASWYDRSQPFVHDSWFYLAEQRAFQNVPDNLNFLPRPESDYWQSQWVLRSWNMQDWKQQVEQIQEAPTRSIPGRPIAFTAHGELITQEATENGQLRLNLLALDTGSANLFQTHTLACRDYSQVMWADEAIYVECQTEDRYWYGPIFLEDTVDIEEAEEKQTPVEPTTQLLKLQIVDQRFTETGKWTLTGYHNLRAVSSEIALISSESWYYGPLVDDIAIEPMVAVKPMVRSELPAYQSGCNIYRLIPQQEPILLKHLETCPYNNDGLAFTENQAWIAEGFAGIKAINWE